MNLFKKWKIRENVVRVIKMYPIVLGCLLIIGALSIYAVHLNFDKEWIGKAILSLAVFTGFALVLRALNLSYESFSRKRHLIILIICLGLSFGYYFTLDMHIDWTVTRTFIILFIQGLMFISLPFIKDDDRAEHFASKAAGRLIISGLLYGIAYGGIAGVFFALEELFGLDISEKIYNDTAIILATTFLPMLWLFGIDYKMESFTSRLYKVLLCYICIPLLLVYSAVVYGFIIKIIFDGFAMPESIIGNLVLWYSLVSIIVAYLARPYEENSVTKFFYKWYPVISVLPISIMFIAIFMRINQYSITVNRYYLLLGGIWLAAIFIYFIFVRFTKKKRLNTIITLSIAFFALISITGPISADTIAEKAQLQRLENIIVPYKYGDSLDVSKMDAKDIMQAQDIIRYLDEHHDGYRESYNTKEISTANITFLNKEQVKEILDVSINRYEVIDDKREFFYADIREQGEVMAPIELEGYRYLLNIDCYDFNNGDIYTLNEYKIQIIDKTDNNQERIDNIIVIYKDNILISELSVLGCFEDRLLSKREMFGEDHSDMIYETADKSIKIVLFNVGFRYDDQLKLISFEGCILLK